MDLNKEIASITNAPARNLFDHFLERIEELEKRVSDLETEPDIEVEFVEFEDTIEDGEDV